MNVISSPLFQCRRVSLALLGAGLILAAPARTAPRYAFTGLGLHGDQTSVARDINDQGQILLVNNLPGKDREESTARSYIYRNGSIREITVDGKSAQGYAINNRGEVLASANFDANDPYSGKVFIYRSDDIEMTGLFTDTRNVAGWVINDQGSVAGTDHAIGEEPGAVIYSNGAISQVGRHAISDRASVANAINSRGDIAGYLIDANNIYGTAYIYSHGRLELLGALQGGLFSEVNALNTNGEAVGYSEVAIDPTYNARHAFHYANGRMQDLGSLGGDSRAWDINDTSQIVGYSRTADNSLHATLWNDGRIYDLNRLAGDGWILHNALGINRFGQVVGVGSHDGAEAEGFLLTLHPEWQGNGNGVWDDAARWNYGGFGSFGFAPGQPHDVVINPGGNATILGGANANVRSLAVSGGAGRTVAFNLNDGFTAAEDGTNLRNATLIGSGTLDGGLQIDAASRVEVGGGQQMRLVGGATNNDGTIKLIGAGGSLASLQTDHLLLNQGQLQLQNADADFAGGLENHGQIQIGFGSNSVSGSVINAKDGQIVFSGNGETAFWDAVTLQSGSEMRVARDAAAVFFNQVVVRGGALLSGAGNRYYEGGLSLGDSPAMVSQQGNASFGSENMYLAEIGGLSAGNQFDQLLVAGNLNFGGVLQLMWWDDFNAKVGDVFDLFDWGSSSGKFARIDTQFATLADGLRWDFSRLYTTGEIGVAAVPLPGSFWLFGSALIAMIGRRTF
ncbi:hypothetical protein QLH52_05840 [Methylomonas sp. OY6]|uniref:Secreted protein with PEP-CTERM sorting signal n=1 Tax=Methylomonas defluvii TaxID=3045149 RepID=A0ABU4UDI7_9GAMM|nr:hypothetical protein [Methylomonas sp. OY6]MDX8126794.1 hypothetical protein [Methylomonas sp. OY6]